MRLKPSRDDRLPEVNLIPMLNAMLAILAFFVMVSISLSVEKSVTVRLPADRYPEATETPPLILEITANGIRQGTQPLTQPQALAEAQRYLQANAQNPGFILLRPTATVTYQQIMAVLLPMQQLGGDRVSLVIRQEPDHAP
jgi:biopolymer transport protein ExbD